MELARGWRFACGCERCAEEGVDAFDVDGAPQTDESKIDAAVRRIENTDVAA
jgi:import receptor subunit TOM20